MAKTIEKTEKFDGEFRRRWRIPTSMANSDASMVNSDASMVNSDASMVNSDAST